MNNDMNMNSEEARRTRLLDFLKMEVTLAKEDLAKFRAEMKVNPARAFEWCDDAMRSAATCNVFEVYIEMIKANPVTTLAERHKLMTQRVCDSATSHQSSTSPASNLMAMYRNEAYAKICHALDSYR